VSALPCDWCKTLADSGLSLKVNCFLTLFIVIFANDLGTPTDFACWNTVISVLSAVIEAVLGTSEFDVNKRTAKDIFCIIP
jgi:NO-binding membrane sensor protein with MHYT domain